MNNGSTLLQDKKLHVFIADDDIDDIDFFKDALADIGKEIKVTVATDGSELMEFLQILTPDIIFLDINMPCMNGLDCLSEIRKIDAYNRIPVVIYSTSISPEHIEKSYELGASMYFEKPVKFETIKKRLTQILSHTSDDLLPQLSKDKFIVRNLDTTKT
jgi:CheY-like chemotaxis protein